jgi:hypothetical protein
VPLCCVWFGLVWVSLGLGLVGSGSGCVWVSLGLVGSRFDERLANDRPCLANDRQCLASGI